MGSLAVETAAIQTKPACAGLKFLIFHQSAQADFVCVDANSIRLILNMTNSTSYSLGQRIISARVTNRWLDVNTAHMPHSALRVSILGFFTLNRLHSSRNSLT